jgi:UDP-GlcNAc:undecaprenyl-phosphate GlcNAc-1-phosphate transferase
MFDIGHYPKFIGQVIAVLIVIFYGDLYVVRFPFVTGGEISIGLGIPFTLFAMVGTINALNQSDGLDGLAGGVSMFSLGAISLLALISMQGQQVLIIAFTMIGGVLGFLRYNTHPARVFMGDSGSQFIGYTLAFLVILLSHRIDTNLSSAAVLLLLGLPIIDSLVVLYKRVRGGIRIFTATKDHIHHRLLDLGFVHRESVVIIYSAQAVFVTSGVLLRLASDYLVMTVYLGFCLLIFGAISLVEHIGWKLERKEATGHANIMNNQVLSSILVVLPRRFLSLSIPVFMIGASLLVDRVPDDFAKISSLIAILILLDLLVVREQHSIIRRALIYIIAGQVGYLWVNYQPDYLLGYLDIAEMLFFMLIAVAFGIAVKFSPRRRKIEFELTATDYLVAYGLLAVFIVSNGQLWGSGNVTFVVQLIIVFYACELLITERRGSWSWLSIVAMIAGGVLGVRGLVLV